MDEIVEVNTRSKLEELKEKLDFYNPANYAIENNHQYQRLLREQEYLIKKELNKIEDIEEVNLFIYELMKNFYPVPEEMIRKVYKYMLDKDVEIIEHKEFVELLGVYGFKEEKKELLKKCIENFEEGKYKNIFHGFSHMQQAYLEVFYGVKPKIAYRKALIQTIKDIENESIEYLDSHDETDNIIALAIKYGLFEEAQKLIEIIRTQQNEGKTFLNGQICFNLEDYEETIKYKKENRETESV